METVLVLLILLVFLLLPLLIGVATMGSQKTVKVKHEASGLIKDGYVGYCWTYFFFGWIVPVIRGEISIGVLHLILTVFTFGFFQLVMPFLYNRQYMTRLLTCGWSLADSEGVNSNARMRLGIASSV